MRLHSNYSLIAPNTEEYNKCLRRSPIIEFHSKLRTDAFILLINFPLNHSIGENHFRNPSIQKSH